MGILLLVRQHHYIESAPGQNGQHVVDNILKYIFLNGNYSCFIQISWKFVPWSYNVNMWAVVQTGTQPVCWLIQYIPRNMHTVFALLCFVVVIHWLIFPYPSGLLHWHCGNLTIAPVPAKQPWWIWINTSCEFIMNDCITTTKQSTTKPCAYFLGYTVYYQASITLNYTDQIHKRHPVPYPQGWAIECLLWLMSINVLEKNLMLWCDCAVYSPNKMQFYSTLSCDFCPLTMISYDLRVISYVFVKL